MNPVPTSPQIVTVHLAAHVGQTDKELIETVKRTGHYLNHVWSLETGSIEFLISDEQGEPSYFFPGLCRENNCRTCEREIAPLLAV